ncbi:MAG: hypothetical protein CL840_18050 [Crocinitomicaceae bacterium]|nr:hypothetical protein [Crocinitomicaceae bacterium]|tara:strand:+ start:35879 stop:38503 length:2625 start_codon:yes stop_codon:yes gene_type:complete
MHLKTTLLSLSIILFSLVATSQSTIYTQDFSSQNGKGAIGGSPSITIDTSDVTWSVDTSDVNFQDASDYIQVVSEKLEFRDTEGNAKWISSAITITNLISLTLSIDLSEVGTMESSDTISVYYKIDNGSETLVRLINDDFTSVTLTDTALSGTGDALYIIVYAKNGADTEKHRIDNVTVKGSCGSSPTESSNFAASTNVNAATLTWTAPTCSDSVMIVAKLSSTISGTPTGDGSSYTSDNDFSGSGTAFDGGKVVYKGNGTTVSISNLTTASTYYFKIWSRTGSNWSSGSEINATVPYIPKLLIAEVADPSDLITGRFVELFNADTLTIDFSSLEFNVCRETNGGGSFTCEKITGTLSPGNYYVIANNASAFSTQYSKTASATFGNTSGNGDDGYFLYVGGDNSSGTLLDAYGVVGEDGSGKTWEYTDSRAYRDSNHSATNATWAASEWTIVGSTASACEPFDHSSAFPEITIESNFSLVEGIYRTLNINGSSIEVTASGDIYVLNKLKLKNGLLNMNSNKLHLGTTEYDCSVTDASSSSYIYGGTVRYYVNSSMGTYKFEIGTAGTEYSPVDIAFNSSTLASTAYLEGAASNSKHPNLPSHVVSYLDRNWTVEATGITSLNYDVDLVYVDDDIQGTESTLLPVKYSGSTWTAPGTVGNGNVDTVGSGSVTVGTNTLTWTGVTSFSIFTGVGDGSPLPVDLLYFNGHKSEEGNLLTWATSSELNSDYFEVEKMSDKGEFMGIGQVGAKGNSNSLSNYEFVDYMGNNSDYSYRLKQVDFNGEVHYSRIIHVQGDQSKSKGISVIGNDQNIWINNLPPDKVIISIINASGHTLNSKAYTGSSSVLFPTAELASGLYIVKISNSQEELFSKKLMINQ